MDNKPYTRDELATLDDRFPKRGLYCDRCKTFIPQFAELTDAVAHRIRMLILDGRSLAATDELRLATGCCERWAKIWIVHSGRPHAVSPGPPCPFCGKPLATSRAQQCLHCNRSWHNKPLPT